MNEKELKELARNEIKKVSGKELNELSIDELLFYIGFYAEKLHKKTNDEKYKNIKNAALRAADGLSVDEIVEKLDEEYKSKKGN